MKKNLLAFMMLFLAFFSVQITYSENCVTVSAGTPVGPDDTNFIIGQSNAADIMATYVPTPDETGATDYAFVITDPNGNILLEVSDDGSFDFSDFEEGEYCFWGFAYLQEELNSVSSTVKGLPASVIAGIAGITEEEAMALQEALPDEPTLGDLLSLIGTFATSSEFTPGEIVAAIEGIIEQSFGLIALSYCIDTTASNYCITVAKPAAVAGGTISTQDETTICADDGEPDIINVTVEGAEGTNMGFIVTDPDLNILSPGVVPMPPDFEGAGSGECWIWHISWEGDLTGTDMGLNAAGIGGNFSLSDNFIAIFRMTGTDAPCPTSGNGNAPVITVLDVDCTGNGEGFVVEVQISGGDPGEGGYQVLSPVSGFTEGDDGIGNPFVLSGANDETNYVIQVMDADGDVVDVELAIQCSKCVPHLTGVMQPESLSLCGDGSLQGQITSTVIDEGIIYTYGLFENEVMDDSDMPIAVSEDGSFSNAGLETGKTYYIVAFAGIDEDGDGWPDADDECREYKGSTEIVFNDEISASIDTMCNGTSMIVTISGISGGNGGPYNLDGNPIDDPYSMEFDGDFGGGILDDGTGECALTIAPITNACEVAPPCTNDAGNFAGVGNQICGDDAFAASGATGTTIDDGSVGVYVLHTDMNDPFGSSIATNDSPSFGFQGYGTTYYVSYIVGPNDGSDMPMEGDDCTFIALGPNVTWFPEYTLFVNVVCEPNPANPAENSGKSIFTVGVVCDDCDENTEFQIGGTHLQTILKVGETAEFTIFEDETPYEVTAEIVGGSPCPTGEVKGEENCIKGLPVEFLYAEGEAQDNGNLIKWATASETDNDYFIVERSVDGIEFVNIHQEAGQGTVSNETYYSFLDSNAPEGLSYYRVKQFDFNGASESSNTFTVIRGEVSFVLTGVVPTVASTSVDINYHAALNSKVEMTIFDVSGKLISQSVLASQTGANTETIDLSNYASGVYFVRLTDGINIAGERFIVK